MSRGLPDVKLTVTVALDVDGVRYEASLVRTPDWVMHADAEVLHELDKAVHAVTPLPATMEPTEGECLATQLLRDWQRRLELDGAEGSKRVLDGLVKRVDEKRQAAWARASEAAAKQPALPGVER